MSLVPSRILAVSLALLLSAPLVAQGPPRQPTQQQQPQQPTPQAPTQDAQRQLEQGRTALRNGDHAAALQALAPLAQQGQPEAQCLLGLMFQKGYGVPENAAEAARWYTLSALQGYGDALFMLGQLYYRGEGVPQDFTKAADLFLLNATTGDADGQWAFGLCVSGGEGRRKDPIEGYAWLYLAAQVGHPEARKEIDKSTLSAADVDVAKGVAQQLHDMVVNHGFDPAKLPKVPVPDGMSLDPNAPATNAAAQGPGQNVIEAGMAIDAEILPTGDVKGTATITFPADVYGALQKVVPDPRLYLRDLTSSRADHELASDARARYDEPNHAVVLDLHLLGVARNRGDGRWEWQTEDQTFREASTDAQGRTIVTFDYDLKPDDGQMVLRGRAVYRMPAGVTGIDWQAEDQKLTYELPYTGPNGRGRLRVKFAARDRILSCLYKVYGLETGFPAQWVGKAVFTNVGDGPITDLRVRFRLGDYSELDLWHKFPEVIPGQTAVAVYRPVLKKSIAELTSTTPVNVVAEWRWIDSEGKEHEDSDGERISVLGRHEFVFSSLTESESTGSFNDLFSNADLVAAWVTRDDPVVKQFAAAANKAAGGAGAPYSDEAAYKVLKACYEIWLANDFTYQGPVGLKDASMSFDNKIVQSMKFPRDVIRDRSGTCIELTALYCAMVNAIGLEAFMILVPGHAFPVVQLPSGKYLPVECTGVAGGKRFGSASFAQAVEAAGKTFEKWAKEGLLIDVDIDKAWLKGVSNPELEVVPADVLQRWNTVLEFTLSADEGGPAQPQQPQQPRQPQQPQPTPNQAAAAFVGRWVGTATQAIYGGQSLQWNIVMAIGQGQGGVLQGESAGETRVPNSWGGSDYYQFTQTLEGQVQGGQLTMRGTQKTLIVNGMQQMLPPDTLSLRPQGNHLVGQFKLPDGTVVNVDVQRGN